MNAVQPINVTIPNQSIPVSMSTVPGRNGSGQPFADVIRTAVSPARTSQRTPNSAGSPASYRPIFNSPGETVGKPLDRMQVSGSSSSNQAANGNAATSAATQKCQNPDTLETLASTSAAVDGSDSSPTDVLAQSPTSDAVIQDQLGERTPPLVSPAIAEAGASSGVNGRKPTDSLRELNATQGNSSSTAILTAASIAVVPVPQTATGSSSSRSPREPGDLSSMTDRAFFKSQAIGNPAQPHYSSISSRMAASIPAVRASKDEGATGAFPSQPQGADFSASASAASHNSGLQHAIRNTEGPPSITSTSAATQNGNSTDDPAASQSAIVGNTVHPQAGKNGSEIAFGDANLSNSVGAIGIFNPGSVSNDPVSSVGNVGYGAASSIHSADNVRGAGVSSTNSATANPANDPLVPHANPADSALGVQNSSSVFSSCSHTGATGNFSSSTAVLTASRATTAEAFTALDSAAAGERGVLLHAAPHQVAVGVADPSLGWVEVRAERVSGQIAAALTTNSAASHAALTSVLPTMATYLQEHHAGVHQVQVESSLTGSQSGTGSQGQAPAQHEAQTVSENHTSANASTNSWNAAPLGSAGITTGQRNSFVNEGQHFSVRA
jgi:hypothetical protein